MKKIMVKISWLRSKAVEMALFGRNTAEMMKDNKNFLTPKVALTEITAGCESVESAYNGRKNGQEGKDKLTNAAIALDELLHTQAGYVSDIAEGDETIIHSGGWISTSISHAKKQLPKESEVGPFMEPSKGGKVKCTAEIASNVSLYYFILVVDGTFNVTVLPSGMIIVPEGTVAYIIVSTKHVCTFTNLLGRKDVFCAVMTGNSAGYSGLTPVSNEFTIA